MDTATPYLLFGGDSYYPSGGWDDYIRSYAQLEDAVAEARKRNKDWWHVVDIRTTTIIAANWMTV